MCVTAARKPRRHGPPPLPRRKLNPDLHRAIRASGHRLRVIAVACGMHSGPELSALLSVGEIRDTTLNVERIERICDIIGFDKGQVFTDGAGR